MGKKSGFWARNARRVTHPEEQTPEQGRRALWAVVAFFAALIVVGGGFWALREFVFDPQQPAASASPTPKNTSDTGAKPVDNDSACVLSDTNADITNTPPTATRWVVNRWAVLPEVKGAGPCQTSPYVAKFAHTQTGALMAAYYYSVHASPLSPVKETKEQLQYAVLDNQLKQGVIQRATDVENGVTKRVRDEDWAGIGFKGYKIVAYSDQSAVIELLLTSVKDGTVPGSATVKLVWKDGDWRIDTASGNELYAQTPRVNVQTFVQWNQSGR